MTKGHSFPSWRGLRCSMNVPKGGWIQEDEEPRGKDAAPYPISTAPDQCSLGHSGHQERRGQATHCPPSLQQHQSQVSQPFFKERHFSIRFTLWAIEIPDVGEGTRRGQRGRRAQGWQQRQEEEGRGGTEREHIQRKKRCEKQ